MEVAGWLNPNPQAVRLLLDRGALPSGVDIHGESALARAACRGSAEVVQILLDRGADPDLGRPLFSAVQCPGFYPEKRQHTEIVHLLLDRGAAVDRCDERQRRPLHFTAMRPDLDRMRLLLDRKADPNVLENNTGNSPLLWASATGSVEAVGLLLDHGAAVNLRNPFDCATALHRAAANGHLGVVRNLLAKGADPELTDQHGDTALGLAVKNNQTSVIDFLRSLGARESGAPTALCPQPAGLQACRAEAPAPRKELPADILPAEEVRSRIGALVSRWEAETGTLVGSGIRLDAQAQVDQLLGTGCYWGTVDPLRSQCRKILGSDNGLYPPLKSYLEEALVAAAAKPRSLLHRVGDAIEPDLVARLGWPEEGPPNRASCLDIPAALRDSKIFFLDQGASHSVGSPANRICVLPGSYPLVLQDAHSGVAKLMKLEVAPDSPPRLTPASSPEEMTTTEVLPDLDWLCPDPAPEDSPLTASLGRDAPAIPEGQRAPFTGAAVGLVQIRDPGTACQKDCRDALAAAIVRTIQLWKVGCTRCVLSTLLGLEVDGQVFLARPLIDRLLLRTGPEVDRFLTRNPRDPVVSADESLLNLGTYVTAPFLRISRSSPLTEKLCRKLDDTRSEPARSLQWLACRPPDQTAPCPACVRVDVALSAGITAGCPDTDSTVACAAVDHGIELNCRDFRFTGLSSIHLGTDGLEQSLLSFCKGTEDVDVMPVLVHEIGHWFGLPHLNDERVSTAGRVNVMVPTFHPEGQCITSGNLRMVDQAASQAWPFRILSCAGLLYPRAKAR
jgi:hypothetical protein